MNMIVKAWDGTGLVPRAFPYLEDPRLKMRSALIDALRELLHVQPFDHIHIREITTQAEISYSSFYRHYATKEALLGDLVKTQVARLIIVGLPLAYSKQRLASCRAVCEQVVEDKRLWRALLTGGAAHKLREEFVRQVMRMKEHPGLLGFLPREVHLTCATGATLSVLAWWLAQRPMPPIDYAARKMCEMITAIESSSKQSASDEFSLVPANAA